MEIQKIVGSVGLALIFSLSHIVHANTGIPKRCERAPATKRIESKTVYGKISSANKMDFFKSIALETTSLSVNSSLPYLDTENLLSCQTIRGYGFAVTNSTVHNYNKLSPELKKEVMTKLFSRKKGANLSYIVLPLSSTDFEVEPVQDYSVCNCKNPEPGKNCFDPKPMAGQIQFLKEAKKINPNLKVQLKPWTQPPFMLEAGTENKKNPYWAGTLDGKWTDTIAQCLASSVDWVEKQGIRVQSITPQNEPGFVKNNYPTLLVNTEKMAKIINTLHPLLKKKHPKVQIIVRDDNYNSVWDTQKEMKQFNFESKNLVFGGHCYVPSLDLMEILLAKGKKMFCPFGEAPNELEYMMSECTGTGPGKPSDFAWWMQKIVLDESYIGASGLIAWNGILDENWGPHNENCENCRGFVNADFSKKEQVTLTWAPEYFALAHIAHVFQPGAKRIVTEERSIAGVGHIIAKNHNGSTAGVFWNPNSEQKTFRVVTHSCQEILVNVPGKSAISLSWN